MAGIDSNTVYMLHMDGADEGTTFTDDSDSAHTVTPTGNTKTDDTQIKFGTTSGYFDGTGDYLEAADHADWAMGSGDCTYDLWIYRERTGTKEVFLGQNHNTEASAAVQISFDASDTIRASFYLVGPTKITFLSTGTVGVGVWTHIALVRDGINLRLFINGTQDGIDSTLSTTAQIDSTYPMTVGRNGSATTTSEFKGWIDEVRISKGIARWVSGFTPPTEAYSAPGPPLDSWFQPASTPSIEKKPNINTGMSVVAGLDDVPVPPVPAPPLDSWWMPMGVPTPPIRPKTNTGRFVVTDLSSVPPAEDVTLDKWWHKPNVPAAKRKQNTGTGWFNITELYAVPQMPDKWLPRYPGPVFKKKQPVNTEHTFFVDFSVPTAEVVNLDKWFQPASTPIFPKKRWHHTFDNLVFNPIMGVQGPGGNYSYTGTLRFEVSPASTTEATFGYLGSLSFQLSPESAIDGNFNYTGSLSFKLLAPDTGVASAVIGPNEIFAVVEIDGESLTDTVYGTVSVSRQDNAAARFTLSINTDDKPASFLNKIINIAFTAADSTGVIADYIKIFKGICTNVSYSHDLDSIVLAGYDYGGLHQTEGERFSADITEVLEGSVYISGSGTFNTGHAPIWAVTYSGSDDVIDGRDYFTDTLTGEIVVPVSSTLIQFPHGLTYSYMNPFGSLKALIQTVADQKGWALSEDGVTIADYSVTTKQPVVSISDESVIDVCRKFLELSGAKVESNLFPDLRIYSETTNLLAAADNHVIDESVYYEGTLNFDIEMDNFLNEQTVRSVQKTNANIEIGSSGRLAKESGEQSPEVLLSQIVPPASTVFIDLNTRKAVVEVRISRANIFSISHSASGTAWITSAGLTISDSISTSDWSMRIMDNDFIFELKYFPWWIVTNVGVQGWHWYVAYPAVDWTLTINGAKIEYGAGVIEDIVEVTASRPVTGITDTWQGDVYENPYIETATHAGNIGNAILTEAGNIYTMSCQVPIRFAKSYQIGDKITVNKGGDDIFKGLIKILNYDLNVNTAEGQVAVVAKGVGFGI